MHYCTSYGPDKSGWMHTRIHGRTHIHQTKIVTTMSRLPTSGLEKNEIHSLNKGKNNTQILLRAHITFNLILKVQKSISAIFKKIFCLEFIILRIQKQKDKQCKSR